MANKPIAVICPMDSEYQWLKDHANNVKTEKIGNYEFSSGDIDGKPVIICKCLIGMTNSAVSATLAIEKYSAGIIINQGTSGAHNKDLHQGDIVLGRDIVQTSAFMAAHRDMGAGSVFEDWDVFPVEIASDVTTKIFHSDSRLLDICQRVKYEHGRVVLGTIGSGDMWNREIDRISYLHEKLGTDCEEMEAFSVAQVCYQFKVPFLAVRVISNSEYYPDELFDHKFGEYCQEYVHGIIKYNEL